MSNTLFPKMKVTTEKKTGRIECGCFGLKHKVMSNCLACGRIHCVEEGPGKCLFCGERLEIIKKLEGYDEAQQRQDMLLFFQDTQAQRTVVRDMSGEDPLKLNMWINSTKSKKLNKKGKKSLNTHPRCAKVQHNDLVDFNAVSLIEEDDIGTDQRYGLGIKEKVDRAVEDADYDD
ncbi:TRIP4/RQT4 C2HC5-type zinc finger domain-containing protein [Entamoeba marina]